MTPTVESPSAALRALDLLALVDGDLAEARGPLNEFLVEDRPPRPGEGEEGSPEYRADLEALARVTFALDQILDVVKDLRHSYGVRLARACPFRESLVLIDDLPPIQPRFGKDRTAWDSPRLRDDVKAEILCPADRETGEIRDLSPEAVFEAVERIVSITGSNVKTTGIKALGLDPEDYCHSEPKDPTVLFVKS